MTQKHGGPAFPTPHNLPPYMEGMSLRDWFAGQAMAAIIAKAPFVITSASGEHECYTATSIGAYFYADAMLAEREKGGAK